MAFDGLGYSVTSNADNKENEHQKRSKSKSHSYHWYIKINQFIVIKLEKFFIKMPSQNGMALV